MSEQGPKQAYYFDVLNNSPGQFRVMARMIDSADESMPALRNKLELNTPGLAMHIGSWIPRIQSIALPHGPLFANQAILGYNKGALMTYDLFERVASANSQNVPNPRFNPANFVDTEAPNPIPDSLLAMSMRGQFLPERFPVIFKSAMTMLSRIYSQPPALIESRVYGLPRQLEDVFIVHFLTGAAEVVLPLERYAESNQLEQIFDIE